MDKSLLATARLLAGGSACTDYHVNEGSRYAALAKSDTGNREVHTRNALVHFQVVIIRLENGWGQ